MTQRVNQFNLTTIRRTEGEIENLVRQGNVKCHTVAVRDRFGDYGLVGLMITGKEAGTLLVDTMLLSCRALGRGVEHRMMAFMEDMAAAEGLDYLYLRYVATKKNVPIRDFVKSVAGNYENKWMTAFCMKSPVGLR